jgi:hypothetical protein
MPTARRWSGWITRRKGSLRCVGYVDKVSGEMRFNKTCAGWRGWLAALCCLLMFSSLAAQAKDLKFEACLVWATDAEKSPDPHHKPVNPEVRRKLSELPLKWKNYFEVVRKGFSVSPGGSVEVTLSGKCKIRVTDVDGNQAEVSLIGNGERVLKRTQPLPTGQMLVLGGNAPDSTGWLVVLKRVE